MSREIDPKNLDERDALYLRDRPWMIDEYRRQGLIAEMDAVQSEEVRPSPEELTRIHTDQMRVGTQVPQQIDRIPNGVIPDDAEDEIDDNYEEWSVAEIKTEIEARNAERGEKEQLSMSGNKAELCDRLHKDDAAEAAPPK